MRGHGKIIILFLSLIYIVVLFTVKYAFNGLGVSEFSLFKFGNLIDLFPFVLIFTALLVKRNASFPLKEEKKILIATSFAILLLLLAILIKISGILGSHYYSTYSYNKMLLQFFLLSSFVVYLSIGFYLILKRKSIAKAVAYSGYFFVFILLIAVILNIDFQIRAGKQVPNKKYDVGIIMGAAVWHKDAPSPILRERILKGIQLYKQGIIGKIQVTGSNAPGEKTEAAVAKKILLQSGIPPEFILFENKTHSTVEQIRFIKKHFRDGEKIAIISDAFHLSRILAMCNFFNVKVNGISTQYKLNWRKSIYYALRDSLGLVLFWTFAT